MAIANYDGSIILTTTVDQSGLKRGMSTMKSGVSSLTSAFGKLASVIGLAFSVGAIVKFGKESADLATKTEASIQRLIDIYGSASQAVGDFIDANAQALGMSRSAAAAYSSVYGNLFSVWADQQTNATLTTKYLNMTAVVASKTGRTIADVQERVRSGLLGNTEAIEDLGIFVNVKTIEMTDAFQRMANGKSWEQLGAYEQQQIRTLAILEQATQKYGNEVSQNTALVRSKYKAAYEDFKNTWGTVVNYILMPILQVLTKVFQYATMALQAIFKISGKTINVDTSVLNDQKESIESAVESQKDLTEAIKETEKEQKKSLAGFDDLLILSSNAYNSFENDISKPIDGTTQTLDFLETQEGQEVNASGYEKILKIFESFVPTLKRIKELFLSGFWKSFQNADFNDLKQSLIGIKESLKTIFESPEVKAAAERFLSSFITAIGQLSGSILSMGVMIAQNLIGGFNLYLQSNASFIQGSVVKALDASDGINETVGNLWTAFSNIFSVFASEEGQLLTEKIIEIFSNAFLAISVKALEYSNTLLGYFSNPFIENEETIKNSLVQWFLSITDFLSTVQKDISETLDSIEFDFDSSIANIGQLWDSMISDIMDATGEWGPELLNLTSELFDSIWESAIEPAIQTIVKAWSDFTEIILKLWQENGEPLLEKIGKFGEETIKIFQSIYDKILKPIIEPLLETISSLWENHIKHWLELIGQFIFDLADGALEIYNEFIAPLVKWLSETLSPVFAWIGETVSEVFNSIATTVSTVLENVFDALGGLIDFITGVFAGDWQRAWEGISSFFTDIWEGVKNTLKGVVNVVIDLLNSMIDGLNAISFDVPDWIPGIGGETFGFNIPNIPRLAQGTIIPPNKEFLATLGDNTKEFEVVSPVSTMKQAVSEAIMEMGANIAGKTEVILEIDGREFGRAVVDQGNRENRRIGTRLVIA